MVALSRQILKGKTYMKTENKENTNETQIRERLEEWAKAVRAKDLAAVMSHYTPDIRAFDLPTPLEYRGTDAYRKNWADWFPTFVGPVGYEIHKLTVTSADDVAFCHSLNHITGARTDGEQTDVWARATVGLRKSGGAWMITHEHFSVPIYMQPPRQYEAALDLKPDEPNR
jgi:ketosteroid isomerase-like protein